MSYELLSEPVRRYVRDKRWESLRPIQAAAISKILTTEENYILASRTASGKTEAAFLPILSKVDFAEPGVQVLYISPLVALINDQFVRIEELCKYLDVTITKWHGEASQSQKEKLVKQPSGIILITPESLEAMFAYKPYYIKALFASLKFIVIDEIHSFIGAARGVQLKSLIARLRQKVQGRVRIIGLSATIGDYDAAKAFTGEPERTKVLLDRTAKEIEARFRYIEAGDSELPAEMLEELYESTKDRKTLIFPNSRGRTEEIAVKLKKIAEKRKGHLNYFSHHSSIDREIREWVEEFAKTNRQQNFCIVCTSTLELGIDIGSVDLVVQVNSTFSIASLIQRVGRSGRVEGAQSNLLLYATDDWSMLQSMACWELYREGFIEPPAVVEKPFDILFHQLLSIVKERSGIATPELLKTLAENAAFDGIEKEEAGDLIRHMISKDFLEDLKRELIVGLAAEELMMPREFCSVFDTEREYKVVFAGKTLGKMPLSPQIRPGENIFLAARIWKIVDVDMKSWRIEVVAANDGKKPVFGGAGGDVHPRIREKMLELVYQSAEATDSAGTAISDLRQKFRPVKLTDSKVERPVLQGEASIEWYTFTGSRINRSIAFLLNAKGISADYNERSSVFEFDAGLSLETVIRKIKVTPNEFGKLVEAALENGDGRFKFSKWGNYLPDQFKKICLLQSYFDPEATLEYLESVKLKHAG